MSNTAFVPPPPRDLQVRPTAEEVAFFREHGYLSVERITTDAELRWLEGAFETVVLEAQASGGRTDGGESGSSSSRSRNDLPSTARHDFSLQRTPLCSGPSRRRRGPARGMGPVPLEAPARRKKTPWHQDEAYWDPERSYNAVAAWLPLHDCPVERGCMRSSRDAPTKILPHDLATDPEASRQLAALDVDFSTAVTCPLKAGGATFHHHRILHFAGPNTTDEPRTAFILEFQTPPNRRDVADERPWFERHRAHGMPGAYVADGKLIPLP